jgi:N-terminal asn amidase, putative (fragment)
MYFFCFLQHLSTSPEAEGADFVSSVRQALLFIHKNPFPSVTIFADNRPRCYRKDDYGNWIRL